MQTNERADGANGGALPAWLAARIIEDLYSRVDFQHDTVHQLSDSCRMLGDDCTEAEREVFDLRTRLAMADSVAKQEEDATEAHLAAAFGVATDAVNEIGTLRREIAKIADDILDLKYRPEGAAAAISVMLDESKARVETVIRRVDEFRAERAAIDPQPEAEGEREASEAAGRAFIADDLPPGFVMLDDLTGLLDGFQLQGRVHPSGIFEVSADSLPTDFFRKLFGIAPTAESVRFRDVFGGLNRRNNDDEADGA